MTTGALALAVVYSCTGLRERPIDHRKNGMMNRPKVYIIKEQMVRDATGSNSMDYSPAMMYGDIEFITRSDMPTYPNSTIRMKWNEDVARFVEAYDPGKDFIITTGQPTAIFAVGHALGVSGKVPRYLIWRREENRYRALDTPSPEFNQ